MGKKRKQVLLNMQKLMGSLPQRSSTPMNVQYQDSLSTATYIRYSIDYLAAGDEKVTAYLYIPLHKIPAKRYPAVLTLHETDPTGKKSVDGEG